jgi:hypothetical protein
MPCYEPLCCNANRKPIPLFSLYNSLNFPDSIAINYCAPSQDGNHPENSVPAPLLSPSPPS